MFGPAKWQRMTVMYGDLFYTDVMVLQPRCDRGGWSEPWSQRIPSGELLWSRAARRGALYGGCTGFMRHGASSKDERLINLGDYVMQIASCGESYRLQLEDSRLTRPPTISPKSRDLYSRIMIPVVCTAPLSSKVLFPWTLKFSITCT